MSTLDILQMAAIMNSEGASLFVSGRGAAAFHCFRSALQLILTRVPFTGQQLLSSPRSAETVDILLEKCLVVPDDWSAEALLADNDPLIFRKAFVFQPRDDDRELSIQIPTYVALIIFNLAATIHIHKRSFVLRNGDHALKVALELYDVGFDLLIQEESCCADDCSNNLLVAILNNKAIISVAFADFPEVSRVLELLKSLLEIILTNRRPHNFSEQEMKIFVLNTHWLQAPLGAAAA